MQETLDRVLVWVTRAHQDHPCRSIAYYKGGELVGNDRVMHSILEIVGKVQVVRPSEPDPLKSVEDWVMYVLDAMDRTENPDFIRRIVDSVTRRPGLRAIPAKIAHPADLGYPTDIVHIIQAAILLDDYANWWRRPE